MPLRQILRTISSRARVRLLWRLLTGRRDFVLLGGVGQDDDWPTETLPDVDSWAPQLLGRTLEAVRYSVIPSIEWEGESWHHVGVAVELGLDDGTAVTLYAHPMAGIRLSHRAARDLYAYTPRGEREHDVTDHPRWRPLVAGRVQSVDVPMSAPLRLITPEPARLPLALHLVFPEGEVWIVAAESTPWEDSGFTLLEDCVIVVFDAEQAEAMGLS